MKTLKNLMDGVLSNECILESIKYALKNNRKQKMKKKHVQDIVNMTDDNKCDYYRNLINNGFVIEHNEILIHEKSGNKTRLIITPTFDEQVIHHMLMYNITNVITRRLYIHAYGSIPGRGAHKASKYVMYWLQHDNKHTKYCLKMDISKFFNSIDHDVLKRKLKKLISDKKYLSLMFNIIDGYDRGIPLGFYTSQWLANLYLMELDSYIKEELKAKYYIRYMDDMIIFSSNKKKLHKMRKRIQQFLKSHLKLQLKGNYQVFKMYRYDKYGNPSGRSLDFMGFVFNKYECKIRKRIKKRIIRKINKLNKKNKITIYDVRQLISYNGWLKHTDEGYNIYKSIIHNTISFDYMKHRIKIYSIKNK